MEILRPLSEVCTLRMLFSFTLYQFSLQVSHADLVAESSLEDANDQPVSELLKLLLRSGGSHQGNSKPSPKPSKTSPPPPSTTTTTTTAGTTTMERREATTPESSTQASAGTAWCCNLGKHLIVAKAKTQPIY